MRLLLALTIMFALLWAGTGIATSRKNAESRTAGFPSAEQDDAQTILVALNSASYTGGVACLAVWGQLDDADLPPTGSCLKAIPARTARDGSPSRTANTSTIICADVETIVLGEEG